MKDAGIIEAPEQINSDQLLAERLNRIYSNQKFGYAASVINAAILAAIHWHTVRSLVVSSWLIAVLLVTLGRIELGRQFQRRGKHPDRFILWHRLFLGGILAYGCAWGMAGILLFPSSSHAHQMITVFTVGGMVAGASATFSIFPSFFLAFSLPAGLPVIIYSLTFQDSIHVAMSAMMLLFLCVMIATCYRNYKVNMFSMRLEYEKQGLIEYLSKAKEQAETVNHQLQTEINIRRQVEAELETHQKELTSTVERRTAELKQRNSELQAEITERSRIEAALRYSEDRYRRLVENNIIGILLIQDQTIIFANPFFATISGLATDEIVGSPFINFVHADDRELAITNHIKRLKGDSPPGTYAVRILDKHGEIHWLEVSAMLMDDGGKPTILVFGRDITQQRKLEMQLFQSEKMASIGQLAAGVAHEINNPVGFVNSNLHTLHGYQQDVQKLIDQYRDALAFAKQPSFNRGQEQFVSKISAIEQQEKDIDLEFMLEDWQQLIQECREGTERIKNIVIDLKSFAHPGKQSRQIANINECIESTLNIVWNELKYNVNVIKEFKPLPDLECYPQQLNQVFMNLLVNAGQAISGKGDIKIQTCKKNGYVEINISDTGCGIAEEDLPKVFDPFYTTKPIGKGTGLGLHVSYNIIKKHNGHITVNSQVGEGTTFTIQLPIESN